MKSTITRGGPGENFGLRTWVNITICISDRMSSFSLTLLTNSETSAGLENYDLDPARYYPAPGLAWDAALKES